jgi:lipid II:glycine glycyltransferase (peptidoglycan interpeptide bridge formation enzyme)
MIKKGGEIINGIMNFSNGSTVHQWGVITDYEYRDLNGGSYLLWKSLERAADQGYSKYDLGRTREGTGVYMFKKSFGGEKVWYDDLHYFPNGDGELPHPENETYEPLKQVWRQLPIPVTKIIGPSLRNKISL